MFYRNAVNPANPFINNLLRYAAEMNVSVTLTPKKIYFDSNWICQTEDEFCEYVGIANMIWNSNFISMTTAERRTYTREDLLEMSFDEVLNIFKDHNGETFHCIIDYDDYCYQVYDSYTYHVWSEEDKKTVSEYVKTKPFDHCLVTTGYMSLHLGEEAYFWEGEALNSKLNIEGREQIDFLEMCQWYKDTHNGEKLPLDEFLPEYRKDVQISES